MAPRVVNNASPLSLELHSTCTDDSTMYTLGVGADGGDFLRVTAPGQVCFGLILLMVVIMKCSRCACKMYGRAAEAASQARQSGAEPDEAGCWWCMVNTSFLKFDPKQEALVRKIAERKHLEFWRTSFEAGQVIFAVLQGSYLLQYLANGKLLALFLPMGSEEIDMSFVTKEFAFGGYGPSTWVLASCVIFTSFPRLLTQRTLHVWIVMSYIVFEAAIATPMPLPQLMGYNQLNWMARFLLTSHCPSIHFIVLTNMLFTATNGLLLARGFEANDVKCRVAVSNLEMGSFCLICLVCLVHRHVLLVQIRSTLAAKSSHNVESAVEKLLNGMCDAVVHLNRDFNILKSSAALDTMLFRSSSRIDLSEEPEHSFLDYLSDDDERKRFRQFLQAKDEAGGGGSQAALPGSLHVTMRDVYQAAVHVQVYHTQCVDAFSNPFHIVGFRWDNMDEAAERGPQGPDMKLHMEVPEGSRPRLSSQRSMDSISEHESFSTRVQSLPLASQRASVKEEIAVWLDTTSRGLPMKQCTSRFFAEVGGPSLKVGTKFLAWVEPQERKNFMQVIQGVMAQLVLDGEESAEPINVRLWPSHLAPHGLKLQAEFAVDLDQDADESNTQGTVPWLKLTFRIVGRVRRREEHDGGHGRHRQAQRGQPEAVQAVTLGKSGMLCL